MSWSNWDLTSLTLNSSISRFMKVRICKNVKIIKNRWSAMKLICTWCWLQIYCLATVKFKDYQKFEWHQDAAW